MSIVTNSIMGIIFGSAIVYIVTRLVAAQRRIASLEQHITKKADEDVVDGMTAKINSIQTNTQTVLSELASKLDNAIEPAMVEPVLPEHPQVESPERAHPRVELPERAHPRVELPERTLPRVELPERAHPRVESPERTLPLVESPERTLPRVESPERTLPHVSPKPTMSEVQLEPVQVCQIPEICESEAKPKRGRRRKIN